MTILKELKGPEALKELTLPELKQLAQEIRQRIIEVMSTNGGHLASSLGAVEFTLALHRQFSSPKDKFIWDVGHQTYPHKILTGRNASFHTVRQTHGLCGFTHPGESPYDHFHAGHAGTALSLALGLAQSRDLHGGDEYVIPIIGDATLTCGMSLEALNNISRSTKRFILVLNDNEMSISKNVGQITRILSRMLSNPTTHRLHQELNHLIEKIPGAGNFLKEQGNKMTSSLKHLVSPAVFFEQFGLSYLGPVDGHDIGQLIDLFEGVKDSESPVVLHLVTKKGQGLDVAELDPVKWHGAKPFDVDTCKFHPSKCTKPTFPKVFGHHMIDLAERDPSVVVVTPAMTAGSCLEEMHEKFPDRCFDVGIAESHSATFAGGLAYGNKNRVFLSIYSTFLQRALDNVFLDICLQELPVVLAIDRAGIAGGDGATHNGIYDISFLNAMPNMVICQPRNGQLLKELLETAHSWQRPTAIRYPNLATEEHTAPLQYRPMGRGEVLVKGKKLLILALGTFCDTALELREKLLELGIEATIVDPIFIKPLDTELLCDLLMTHDHVVTLEEHALSSGFGSIVNSFLISNGYQNVKVLNCGIPDAFVHHGNRKDLLEETHLSADKILRKIKNWLGVELPKKQLLV